MGLQIANFKTQFKGLPISLKVGEYEHFFYAMHIACPLCAEHMYNPFATIEMFQPYTGCTFNKFGHARANNKFGKHAGCFNMINILLKKAGQNYEYGR